MTHGKLLLKPLKGMGGLDWAYNQYDMENFYERMDAAVGPWHLRLAYRHDSSVGCDVVSVRLDKEEDYKNGSIEWFPGGAIRRQWWKAEEFSPIVALSFIQEWLKEHGHE